MLSPGDRYLTCALHRVTTALEGFDELILLHKLSCNVDDERVTLDARPFEGTEVAACEVVETVLHRTWDAQDECVLKTFDFLRSNRSELNDLVNEYSSFFRDVVSSQFIANQIRMNLMNVLDHFWTFLVQVPPGEKQCRDNLIEYRDVQG